MCGSPSSQTREKEERVCSLCTYWCSSYCSIEWDWIYRDTEEVEEDMIGEEIKGVEVKVNGARFRMLKRVNECTHSAF